jgi:hypothetical protein
MRVEIMGSSLADPRSDTTCDLVTVGGWPVGSLPYKYTFFLFILCNLRLGYDGWLAGRVIPLNKYIYIYMLFILCFFSVGPKTSVLFVLAQGCWRVLHPPAKTPFSRQHKSFMA